MMKRLFLALSHKKHMSMGMNQSKEDNLKDET